MNDKTKKLAQKGFTIIEVMIVLAIAGLILVVVLVAVPQLQRNQRDNNRKNVVSRLSTEFGTYAENNNGKYPFGNNLSTFTTNYISGSVELTNPTTGNEYTIVVATDITTDPQEDQLMVYPGGKCDGENVTGTISATSRKYAIRVQLERSSIYYCIDNN